MIDVTPIYLTLIFVAAIGGLVGGYFVMRSVLRWAIEPLSGEVAALKADVASLKAELYPPIEYEDCKMRVTWGEAEPRGDGKGSQEGEN